MKIIGETLRYALDIAIKQQEQSELQAGFTVDSAMLATWREARRMCAAGATLEYGGSDITNSESQSGICSVCHRPYDVCDGTTEPALSLLVIDLGDRCVVKVEKGDMSDKGVIAHLCYYVSGIERVRVGPVIVFDMPFIDVQDAINRHFATGEKPLPRIDPPTNGNYTLHVGNVVKPYTFEVPFEMLNALSQLAGHPLPVWTGGGEWVQLAQVGRLSMEPHAEDRTDCQVWRFTRR